MTGGVSEGSFNEGVTMKITEKLLREHDKSCFEEAIALFTKHWPSGVTPNVRTLTKALKLGLDVSWLTRLLEGTALAEYEEAMKAVHAEYSRKAGPALKRYAKAAKPMQKEFEKAEAVFKRAEVLYAKKRRPFWKKFERIERPAYKQYRKARNLLLVAALRAQK